ncbi:MAG: TIGR00730 family Rossman fold protein [Fuerstiella sp.]
MAKKHLTHPRESESEVIEHLSELRQHSELIDEIKETADKLAADGATRGDLKILSRALRELRYAFKVFTPYRRNRKVTVFGSARTQPDSPDWQQAELFGRRIAEEGWMVVTGAGGGIMEAAHAGCGREMAMGLNILLPFEQEANPVIEGDEKLVNLKYFFTRKLLFVKEVHAVVSCPGGFGTQDEAFETLTLVQTGKRDLMPMVFLDKPGGTYWSGWLDYIRTELLDKGMISPSDMSLFLVTDDVEEAVDEVLDFYSVYNSMRFIRDKLVIRLHREPSEQLLERLNDEFQDVVSAGQISKTKAHKLEADDEHLLHLPRLTFQFNRRAVGRLREMVDLLNAELSGA